MEGREKSIIRTKMQRRKWRDDGKRILIPMYCDLRNGSLREYW